MRNSLPTRDFLCLRCKLIEFQCSVKKDNTESRGGVRTGGANA